MSIPDTKSWSDFWCTAHNHLDTEWPCVYTRNFKADPSTNGKSSLFVHTCQVSITFSNFIATE